MKKYVWLVWIVLSVMLISFYGYKMFFDTDKKEFLIGDASHGHFQIELACSACHTQAFGGEEVLQNACTTCHADELKAAHDSHPKKKFTDPRNADRVDILDARYCITCHVEHKKEQTNSMGVTLPNDYCFHCHQDIGKDRDSHKDLAFDSCASAGCHNYHDNRALYEDFLVQNAGGSWVKEMAELLSPNAAKKIDLSIMPGHKMYHPQLSLQQVSAQYPEEVDQWSGSSHALAGVNCGGCHSNEVSNLWIEKPEIEQCKTCHVNEAKGFTQGKHGMRLAQKLPAISSSETSALAFKQQTAHTEQGCNSCHSAHAFDTRYAAKEACLTCHNDEHSLAFDTSPHGQLFAQLSARQLAEENAVSCATCHMPSIKETIAGETVVAVQHNQNDNLRPNEKMIRPICMQCHSLEFSIDALADENLIKNNFSGKPGKHIPSIDWAIKRAKE